MVQRLRSIIATNRFLLVILMLALLLRVLYLVQYHQSPEWEQLTVDNWYHHHWAETVADGNVVGDTTYFRAPLYTFCLGLFYALFGTSLWTARLLGLLIGLASILMTYLLARRIAGKKPALAAAALHAIYPTILYFEFELLLDPLFTLLTQMAVYRFLIWLETPGNRNLLYAGLIFGLAAITRPSILVAILLVAAWLAERAWRNRTGFLQAVLQVGIFVGGALICILPVTVRNLVIAGDPVLISSQGGINLYIGNNNVADGLSAVLPEPLGHNWQLRQIRHIAESEQGRALKPGEVSDHWRDKAVTWIVSHPARFVSLLLNKFGYQFTDREISNNRQLLPFFDTFPVLRYNPLSFGVIFPLALLGAISLWRRHQGARFIVVLMLVYMAAMSLFFFNSRFRLPLLPYYLVFATAGAWWLAGLIRTRSRQLIWLSIVAGAAAWFSLYPPMSFPDRWTPQSLISRGLFLYQRNDYDGASGYFRDAANLEPAFPEVNLNLGACYFRLGQADSAAACFRRDINLHPGRYKAYYNLASLHLVNDRIGEAIELVDQALAIAPYSVPANIIRLRAAASDSTITTDSLLQLVEAAAAATDDELVVLNLGAGLLARDGCRPAVTKCLHRAETATPPPIETDDQAFEPNSRHTKAAFNREKARTYYLLGFCHAQSGRLEKAVRYTERAIVCDTCLVEAYINLSAGYRSLGRLVEADSVLAEAAARFPQNDLLKEPTWR